MFKAYKYRIYPNQHQKELIDRTFGICRLVYNLALETKMNAWQRANINLSAYDLCYQLVDLKKDYPWMKDIDSHSMKAEIYKLDKAFKNFYRGEGYPKFKKKGGHQSFHSPANRRKVDFKKGLLTIPKIDNIKIIFSRIFDGDIKTVTISRTPTNKYYASILVDNNNNSYPKKTPIIANKAIGIDIGIKSFAVTSNGQIFEANQNLKNSLKRLQCLQRRSSRKKKGGKNRKKANKKVAILYEKITNQRADYIHNITTYLVRDSQADTFAIENLNVIGMLKNNKLSKVIQDASFGEFRRQMKYKCDWYGKNLIVIGMFEPSSKTCSGCGFVNDALILSDREWICECGAVHDRDLNAAKNILKIGLEKYSGVGNAVEPVESRRLRRAKKQEFFFEEMPKQ